MTAPDLTQAPWHDPAPPLWRWARIKTTDTLPVRLHRRRLFIVPSYFGLFSILAVMGLVLQSLQHRSPWAVGMFLLLDLMLIVALVRTHHSLAGLEVVSVQVAPAYAGELLMLTLIVRWRRRWGRSRLVAHWGATSAPLQVDAQHMATVHLQRPAPVRGVHPLAPLLLETRQPFGIARALGWVWPDLPVYVYPQPSPTAVNLETLGSQRQGGVQMVPEDEPHHLRLYRIGDARSKISWKASAKRGQWMVLEQRSPHQGGPVWLDWDSIEGTVERKCSILARAVLDAERQQRRYGLHLPHIQLPLSHGPQHRHACLRALAEVTSA